MWDAAIDSVMGSGDHLSHDLPCPKCGHAVHTFLACDERCDCAPVVMPGAELVAARR